LLTPGGSASLQVVEPRVKTFAPSSGVQVFSYLALALPASIAPYQRPDDKPFESVSLDTGGDNHEDKGLEDGAEDFDMDNHEDKGLEDGAEDFDMDEI
jgi:hypothetical protein